MIKELVVLGCLISVLALSGCVGSSNTNPPTYIKQTSALKEGDGIQVYIILADSAGQMTSSDGAFGMTISSSSGSKLLDYNVNVKASNFQNVKLGQGAFEHDALIFNAGRFPFSDMMHTPSGLVEVKVIFTPTGGKTLTDKTTAYI